MSDAPHFAVLSSMGLRGPKGGSESEGIGRAKGGLTRQVVALTDAVGHRIRFGVLPGQTHDLKAGPELRDDLTCEMLMGDKAFDADGVLETVAERGATAVIPPRSNRSTPRDFDRDAYKERHRIENVFATIKINRNVRIVWTAFVPCAGTSSRRLCWTAFGVFLRRDPLMPRWYRLEGCSNWLCFKAHLSRSRHTIAIAQLPDVRETQFDFLVFSVQRGHAYALSRRQQQAET